jgi:hypothetical protein
MTDSIVLSLTTGEYSDVDFAVIGVYDSVEAAFQAALSHLLVSMVVCLEEYWAERTPPEEQAINQILNGMYCNIVDGATSLLIRNRHDGAWPGTMFWRMESYRYEMWPVDKGVDKHYAARVRYMEASKP